MISRRRRFGLIGVSRFSGRLEIPRVRFICGRGIRLSGILVLKVNVRFVLLTSNWRNGLWLLNVRTEVRLFDALCAMSRRLCLGGLILRRCIHVVK